MLPTTKFADTSASFITVPPVVGSPASDPPLDVSSSLEKPRAAPHNAQKSACWWATPLRGPPATHWLELHVGAETTHVPCSSQEWWCVVVVCRGLRTQIRVGHSRLHSRSFERSSTSSALKEQKPWSYSPPSRLPRQSSSLSTLPTFHSLSTSHI